jgi:hypothetical protein
MKNKLKIAVSSPQIKLCDPYFNAAVCADAAKEADSSGADIIVFPELTLSGATAADLFFQELLPKACERALGEYLEATKALGIMSFIGLPLLTDGNMYNAVACISEGEILGITVAGALSRHFVPAPDKSFFAEVCQRCVEVGRNLIYTDDETRANIFVKVGEDGKIYVYLNPSEVSLAIGKNGSNIKLANMLLGADIEIFRDLEENEEEEDDVLLSSFSDEIDEWIIEALQKIGCDTAKSVINLPVDEIARRADLEEETVIEVQKILRSEFED